MARKTAANNGNLLTISPVGRTTNGGDGEQVFAL